jgi:hypothetical protein
MLCHDDWLAGHFGVEKTLALAKRDFYWPEMDESAWEPAENLQNAQEAIRDYESRTRQVDMTTEQDQLLEEPSGPSGQQESIAKRRGGSAQPRRGKKSRPPRNKKQTQERSINKKRTQQVGTATE